MNCPHCNRPNSEGLVNCDYCGTPLPAPAGQQCKTEAGAPARPPRRRRVTQIEDDPFSIPTVSAFNPPERREDAPSKRGTWFDSGRDDRGAPDWDDDPFGRRPPSAEPVRQKEAPGRRVIGWMITFDGCSEGAPFILREGRNAIGRDGRCEISLPGDQMISETHAFMIWRMGHTQVADNNSQNGTFLNEEDVLGQVEVKDNDVIRVGRTRLLVRLLDTEKIETLWKLTGSRA